MNNPSKSEKVSAQKSKPTDEIMKKTKGTNTRETSNDVFSEQTMDALKVSGVSSMPQEVAPMLATLVDKPVEGDWIYEIKWDGFRALAFKNNNETELRSRNDKSFEEKFYL